MLKRAGRVVLIVVVAVVGVCAVIVMGAVVFFYLNGMWPGTHSNPAHILQ